MKSVLGFRARQRFAHDAELADMDKALSLVGGSFLAASKLLDMSPQRFRNLVFTHKWLKAKWGKQPGFQGRLPFRIEPHSGDYLSAEVVQYAFQRLTKDEQTQVREWIDSLGGDAKS
jgi:hypothetical protein